VYQNVTVKAAIPGTPDLYATTTRQTYVAADEEVLTYDLDGNLLTDGRWTYQWAIRKGSGQSVRGRGEYC